MKVVWKSPPLKENEGTGSNGGKCKDNATETGDNKARADGLCKRLPTCRIPPVHLHGSSSH